MLSFRIVSVTDAPTRLSSVPADSRTDSSFMCVPRGDVTLGVDDTVADGAAGTVGPTGDLTSFSIDLQPAEEVWAVAPAAQVIAVAVWEGGV